MTIGPLFSDPIARQLYAEIASVESQHIVHYGSMINPDETPLEKMLLQEACEEWNGALFQGHDGRDAAEILGDGVLPAPIVFKSHRSYLRKVIADESSLRRTARSSSMNRTKAPVRGSTAS